MRYYIKKDGYRPRETSYADFRNAVRRKGSINQVWISGGEKVARCAIVKS